MFFLTSEWSQMCCSNSLAASVPAAAESPVVGDDVILTAATRPLLLTSTLFARLCHAQMHNAGRSVAASLQHHSNRCPL